MNFRPLLITSNTEEIIQAWEGEEAKPMAELINSVMLLLIGPEKQLLAV